jgi:hypothetical protein
MDYYEIITKLIGPIQPVGESNEDSKRLDNLTATTDLIDKLLMDVMNASNVKDRYEHSMKQIGLQADLYISETKTWLIER